MKPAKRGDWAVGSFYISAITGNVMRIGWIKGHWGIDERNRRDWAITHLPTKLRITTRLLRTLREAMEICDKLDALPVRWRRIKSMKSYPKKVRDAAKAICA